MFLYCSNCLRIYAGYFLLNAGELSYGCDIVIGSVGTSNIALHNLIYNGRAEYRQCSLPCLFKDPATLNDGFAKFSNIFGRLLIRRHEVWTLATHKEGLVSS